MAMKIEQVGLSPGVPGQARRDGLSTGALVTLTDTQAGGSSVFEILWVDPADTTTVSTLTASGDDHIWTFSPTANVTGPIRILLIHTLANGVVTFERRIFGIPDTDGFVPPAPGERASTDATLLNADDSGIIDACERNWPLTDFPMGNPFGWSFDVLPPAASAGAASQELFELPDTPNALDEEFASDTLDTAWQFYDQTAGVVRTPTLGISPFVLWTSSTTPPRYTVNASGSGARKSWLKWQVSDEAGTYWVTKPGTLSVGQWLIARLQGPVWAPNANAPSAGGALSLVLCGTTSSHPNTTAFVSMGMTRDGSGANIFLTSQTNDTGGGGSTHTVVPGASSNAPSFQYYGIFRRTSTVYHMMAWNEGGNYAQMEINGQVMTNVATLNRIGFFCASSLEGGSILPNAVFGADFIRISNSPVPF